ncbi:MAG: hypothetical protein P4L79_14845 [Legionella sp.]|uniref:hypothetical protein n=1 Tax=Legionella sp. TaxID=459 RepID=UPI00284F8BAC|nr:hypothetical protein [Legionella sp.]
MLKNWQKKFPQNFQEHPNLFTELTPSAQDALSDLLINLDELELLNERSLNCILDNATNPIEYIELITQMLKAGINAELIPDFLSKFVAINGLSRAIRLFDLSSFAYNEEHLLMFSILTKVLANPLCQTIFDARLRSFSDYSIPNEPLLPQNANNIIQQLYDLKDEESRIRTFFNFFTQFRPVPCSQRYLTATDSATQVAMALESYCAAKIETISTYQDSLEVKEMIQILQTQGGNETHFEALKYIIASDLEAENWASTKDYDQLMQEIWQALTQPQTDLRDFSTLNENSNRARFITAALNAPTLLFIQPAPIDRSQSPVDRINEQISAATYQ